MTYELVFTSAFLRTAEKFKRAHPHLTARLALVFRDLEADPFHSRLRLHSLAGQFAGFSAVSVTYEYRIKLKIDGEERRITLYDIGSHDEVYR